MGKGQGCNLLSTGGILEFRALRRERTIVRIHRCVATPLYVGTPISTYINQRNFCDSWDVSIPYLSGHPFLLDDQKREIERIKNVSIPYLSGHPFLPVNFRSAQRFRFIVSIPYLSGHPFLRTGKSQTRARHNWCVNPLSIGTPISTLTKAEAQALDFDLCQSPIYRDTHFYGIFMIRTGLTSVVSIPYLSGHPFLQPVAFLLL